MTTHDRQRHRPARAVSDVWAGGGGPTHADIGQVFDLFDLPQTLLGSKRERVYDAIMMVSHEQLREFVRELLVLAEESGSFAGEHRVNDSTLRVLRKRIAPLHLSISGDGAVVGSDTFGVDPDVLLTAPGVREHVERLSRALTSGDTALVLGTSKELLETTAKLVLASTSEPIPDKFPALLASALEALGLHAKSVEGDDEISKATRQILGALQKIGTGVNDLRNARGTGHGRAGSPKLSARHARLAGGAAVVLATIMLDTFEERATAMPTAATY